MSTAKLVMWLHWQLIWLLFRLTTSQPLEDQPPVPPILNVRKIFVKIKVWQQLSFRHLMMMTHGGDVTSDGEQEV